MGSPTVDQLASTLGIKKKVLEADIRDLAWLWEMTMRDMDAHNPLSALDVLNAIARAYIRGRGCRMGSYQTLWKHLPTKAAVMYHLVGYVSEENDPAGFILFPHLRDCGVTSLEFLWTARELNTERRLKQEEKEKQEHERKSEEVERRKRCIIEELGGRKSYDVLDEIRRMVDDEGRKP